MHSRVMKDNESHRDKIKTWISEFKSEFEQNLLDNKWQHDKLLLKCNEMHSLTTKYNDNINRISVNISDCVAGSEKLKNEACWIVKESNDRFTKETDEKMIKFTENFINSVYNWLHPDYA